MIDLKQIENVIFRFLVNGNANFVIYPFGKYGQEIKRILNNSFGIESKMIVDNYKNDGISDIHTSNYLKENYEDGDIIILAIEDEIKNKEIFNELIEYVHADNIVNIINYSLPIDLHNFKLTEIIPELKHRKYFELKKELIKIRFVCMGRVEWNSYKTLLLAFKEDIKYDVLVIVGDNCPKEVCNYIEEMNIQYIFEHDYIDTCDEPNILILSWNSSTISIPVDRFSQCKLIIALSMMLVNYFLDTKYLCWFEQRQFKRFNPDYYIYDSLVYQELQNPMMASDKNVMFHNPKFDGIYEAINRKNLNSEWEKLRDKKIVLWATCHGVSEREITYMQTFDLYAKCIFDYMENNKDVGLIFRPHPAFIKEMIQLKVWNEEVINVFKRYINQTENIVIDLSETYDAAYSVCDGIISDGYTGVLVSSLAVNKPVLITYRDKIIGPMHKEIHNAYEVAYSTTEIVSYLDNIKNGIDIKKEARKNIFKKYIGELDGKNGKRIKKFIDEKFIERNEEIRCN